MTRRRRPDDDQLDLFGVEGNRELENWPPSPSGLEPADRWPAGFLAGTCAFQHDHWRGVFYPEKFGAAKQLGFYARYCNAVEIDGSFYRVPSASTVRRWAEETPPTFRFALKAPKSLTHDAQLDLKAGVAAMDWGYFLEACRALGDRVASVLLQLGPRVTAAQRDHLAKLIESASGIPLAVEFRHLSWNTRQTNDLLAARGVARAWTDAYLDPRRGVRENDPILFERTGPFVYARLLGNVETKYDPVTGGLNHTYGSVLFDRREDLAGWIERLRAEVSRGVPVQCFINNHYEGFSPLTVERLRKALAE